MEILNPTNNIPSRRNISKGKALLKEAIGKGLLSEHDIAYLKVATDPWHDTSIESFVGVPDEYIGRSVTEVITVTQQISNPFGTGTGNFNCRINTNPYLGLVTLQKSRGKAVSLYNEAPTSSPPNWQYSGTIDVQFSNQANPFVDYPSPTNLINLTLPPEVMVGNVKIAGCGLEIVNTTAELYKQGTVSIARVPQPSSSQLISARIFGNRAGGTAGIFCNVDCVPVVSMPLTQSELTTYPDFVQWEAREGLYSVIRQYDFMASSPVGWRGVMRFIDTEPSATDAQATNYDLIDIDVPQLDWQNPGTSGLPVSTYVQNKGVIPWPSDSVCAMFTGLSETTTLALKVKFYIERRVNTSIPALRALVPFTKDSPSINPKVLMLVSQLWADLPVAVMYKENPAGEWWDRILGAVGEIAPQVLSMIPHPIAQAAATGIKAIANNSNQKRVEQSDYLKLQTELERLKEQLRQKRIIELANKTRAPAPPIKAKAKPATKTLQKRT